MVYPTQWPWWVGYLAAIILEGLLTLGELAVQPYFPLPRYPILYVLVIMFVAYVFGEGPAVLAFFAGFLLFDYFFIPPLNTVLPHGNDPQAWAALTAFMIGTLIVGVSMVLIRRSRRRVERLLVRVENELLERQRAEAALREAEAHQLDFYRHTIMAATAGKLIITQPEEIERIAGPAIASWSIDEPLDTRELRHRVAEIAETVGIPEDRIQQLALCVGEAATNAIKHAGGGTASVHRTGDSLLVLISDRGPGIAALNLPDVALVPGFSSAGTLGMGYKAMIAFADKVYLATGPDGTMVAVEMKFRKPETSPFAVSLGADSANGQQYTHSQ